MRLARELLAKGAECAQEGGILTPHYFLFRRQIR
jgi:hypothetical protein